MVELYAACSAVWLEQKRRTVVGQLEEQVEEDVD